MAGILIAYDNRSNLSDFFQGCADEARQACVDNGILYDLKFPPNLTEREVIGVMPNYQLCFIAAHGDRDAIYNEQIQEVISTTTINYNFNGKGLYCIACSCAQNLHFHLQRIGLELFVGYNQEFKTKGDISPFIESAMSGLKSILSGDNFEAAKQKMLSSFDEQIKLLGETDPMAAALLLDNKEAIVFQYNNNLVLQDL